MKIIHGKATKVDEWSQSIVNQEGTLNLFKNELASPIPNYYGQNIQIANEESPTNYTTGHPRSPEFSNIIINMTSKN